MVCMAVVRFAWTAYRPGLRRGEDRDGDAHHRVTPDQRGELFFAPAFGPSGTHGEYEITHIRRRVMYAHGNVVGQVEAEFAQNGARFAHHPAAVTAALIPVRRQAEQPTRIA